MAEISVIKKPITTEKATDLNNRGQYVFMVTPQATKNEIKKALRQIYRVNVVSVNIVNLPPKTRRYRGLAGKIGRYKKAVVTLKSGEKIDLGK